MGFIVITLYYFSYYLAYFLSENVINILSPTTSLMIGTGLNALYVGVYIFPVSCVDSTTGGCNHGFIGFLLILFSIIGGCGASLTWAAKSIYLDRCNTSETEKKHRNIFNAVYGFGGVLAALFGLALFVNVDTRNGLYVIMFILSISAAIVQLCKLWIEY